MKCYIVFSPLSLLWGRLEAVMASTRRILRLADAESDDEFNFGARNSSAAQQRSSEGGLSSASSVSLARHSVVQPVPQRGVNRSILDEDSICSAVILTRKSGSVPVAASVNDTEAADEGLIPPSHSNRSRDTTLQKQQQTTVWPIVTVFVDGVLIATTTSSMGQPTLETENLQPIPLEALTLTRLAMDRCVRKLRDHIESIGRLANRRESNARSSSEGTTAATDSSLSDDSDDDGWSSDETDASLDEEESESDDSPSARRRRRIPPSARKAGSGPVKKVAKKSCTQTHTDLTVSQLKSMLKERGLPVSGRKSRLLARLGPVDSSNNSGLDVCHVVTTTSDSRAKCESAETHIRTSLEAFSSCEEVGDAIPIQEELVEKRSSPEAMHYQVARETSRPSAEGRKSSSLSRLAARIGFVSPAAILKKTVQFLERL